MIFHMLVLVSFYHNFALHISSFTALMIYWSFMYYSYTSYLNFDYLMHNKFVFSLVWDHNAIKPKLHKNKMKWNAW
jgi:hypothetical protein